MGKALDETIMTLPELKQQILSLLMPLEPEKVILFGSYAWGNPSADSDIDLYIVTKDSSTPTSFHERSELNLRYARAIAELCQSIPVDLIVHTFPCTKSFWRLIVCSAEKYSIPGFLLYETCYNRMVQGRGA
jgi:predicted nucleotidyltransferase